MRTGILLLLSTAVLGATEPDVLLPAETDQISFVNVKRLAGSSLVKNHLMKEIKEKLKATQLPTWLEEMGIDPWKDVETVTLGMTGPKDKPEKDEKQPKTDPMAFLILRGTFNGEKLMTAGEKATREFGDKVSIVKEGELKLIKVKTDEKNFFYVTMIDEKTVVGASSSKLIQEALKQADDRKAKSRVRPSLADLVRKLDDKAVYFQAMEVEPDMFKNIGENPLVEDIELLKKQLAAMTSYAITVQVGTDVSMELATAMKGKEDAAAFGESAKQMVEKGRALLPLVAVGAAEWTPVVNDLKKSMKVTVEGEIVKLKAKISGDAISRGLGAEE